MDPRLKAVICEGAARSGVDLETWLISSAGQALPEDLQDKWRTIWGQMLIEDYEAEFGPFTEEQLKAAERVWQGSR